jgi:hypothetical protein
LPLQIRNAYSPKSESQNDSMCQVEIVNRRPRANSESGAWQRETSTNIESIRQYKGLTEKVLARLSLKGETYSAPALCAVQFP